eukprot:TRINITY_DN38590_c0_g1_i1.p1 TRINITY_DN38590_c0_g1~~TRINITY_DN38590_c0_g1_i1.p1  ORF type:complete len:973 (-),score=164.65 TRINITY_DN38590_c0_g1_i1:370-3288(-)
MKKEDGKETHSGGGEGAGAATPSDKDSLRDSIPSESEILVRLLTVLGQCPSRSMALAEIREKLPPPLRGLTEDVGSVQKWVQGFSGLLEVTGLEGEERIVLLVGRPPPVVPAPVAPAALTPASPPSDGASASAAPPSGTSAVAAVVHAPKGGSGRGGCVVGGGSGGGAGGGGGSATSNPKDDEHVSPSTVQLRGLPFRANEREIKAFLGQHANNLVTTDGAVKLLMNRDGRPSGFARLQFVSPEAAKACQENLHEQKMGDRYIEVLACTERAGKMRHRRAVEAIPTDDGTTTAGVESLDTASEAMERERILQECRNHMRMPGNNHILLSMLGAALTSPARAYLRRANLGLKHFLARFPTEFRVEGPKGIEKVLWAGAGLSFRDYALSPAEAQAALSAASAAGASSDFAAAILAAAAAAAAARTQAGPNSQQQQQQNVMEWEISQSATMFGADGMTSGVPAAVAGAGADNATAVTAMVETAAHVANGQAATQSAASQTATSRSLQEPTTPKLLMSPAPPKSTMGIHCDSTPSNWGSNRNTPARGFGVQHLPALGHLAAATHVGAMQSGGYPPGEGWPPYAWPPPWASGGWGAPSFPAWPGQQADTMDLMQAAANRFFAPRSEGLNGASGGGSAGCRQASAGGKRGPTLSGGGGGGATGAAAVVGSNAASAGATSAASTATTRPDGPAPCRSHAHLHPQSHPFAHLPRPAASAPSTTMAAVTGVDTSGGNENSAANGEAKAASSAAGDTAVVAGTNAACLRLRGLPFNMTVQDVLAFFAQHDVADRIADGFQAAQLLRKANGKPSGQAVVQMRSRGDAEIAQAALHNKWTGGRYIEVFVYGEEGETVGDTQQSCNAAVAEVAQQIPSAHNPGSGFMLPPTWASVIGPGNAGPPPVPFASPGCATPVTPMGAPPPPPTCGDSHGEDPWAMLFSYIQQPNVGGGTPQAAGADGAAGPSTPSTRAPTETPPRATLQV